METITFAKDFYGVYYSERMERKNFATRVSTASDGFQLKGEQCCLMLGSCFTEHIGAKLQQNKFDVTLNPFGILYNPDSIFSALECLLEVMEGKMEVLSDSLFFAPSQGLWNSWLCSSVFSSVNREEVLCKVTQSVKAAVEALQRLDVLFLTFGTNHAYYLASTGQCVANCHKQQATMFQERILSVEDVVDRSRVLKCLKQLRPDLKLVFTVSPYRYAKYGFHGSQLCKSVLLLAVEQLVKIFDGAAYYFPAYEIVMDELRDYRFYAEDMLHPSAQSVDYIWNIFLDEWVSFEMKGFVIEWSRVLSDLNHRPINGLTVSYQAFLSKLAEKINCLQQKYPNFAFNKEVDEVKNRLQQCKHSLFSNT